MGSALAILLLLVVYWEKADQAGEGIGLLLASFPGLVNNDNGLNGNAVCCDIIQDLLLRFLDLVFPELNIHFIRAHVRIGGPL